MLSQILKLKTITALIFMILILSSPFLSASQNDLNTNQNVVIIKDNKLIEFYKNKYEKAEKNLKDTQYKLSVCEKNKNKLINDVVNLEKERKTYLYFSLFFAIYFFVTLVYLVFKLIMRW